MKLFRKRKKAENVEIRENVIAEEMPEGGDQPGNRMLDECEQMIEAAKALEDTKSEYKVVTSYLNDIQLLEDMSEEEMAEIRQAAENVVALGNTRTEYMKTEKKINDAQFRQMQREEDEIPDASRRLESSEAYQAAVTRDMRYLESEKTKWVYNAEALRDEQNFLRKLSIILFSVAVIVFAVLLVLQSIFAVNTQWIWMLFLFAAGVCAFLIYHREQNNAEEIRQSDRNRNHAITLLNKMKIKYVNATNAVDYACEKYHVKNSYEFNQIWEEYKEAVEEREKFQQLNEELDFYNAKLLRALRSYRLYDTKVWLDQAKALVDPREMVEIKHDLIERRQKLRAKIENDTRSLKDKRKNTERMLVDYPGDTADIREILNSIDRLGGL